MGQFLEIIFFALLSAYLFYRLWTIMGQETDEDIERRQRHQRSLFGEEDNVIPLRKKNETTVDTSYETRDDEYLLKAGVRDGLKQLRKQEPDFDIKEFLSGANSAYEMIINAYSKGDLPTLKSLLTDNVFHQFKQAIKQQADDKTVTKTSIDRIDRTDIDTIKIINEDVRITVRYHSRQVIVTQKDNGEIIDNPAEISIPITDIWTFCRRLKDPNPNWYLMATASESYRD